MVQSAGSEWRRLHFNSGGIRGKEGAGFTPGTAARAPSITPAVRTRGGRGGSRPPRAGGSLWGTVQGQNKATKRPPKRLEKVAPGKSRQGVPVPPSTMALGGLLPGCPPVLPGCPLLSPSCVPVCPSSCLVTLLLPWCPFLPPWPLLSFSGVPCSF